MAAGRSRAPSVRTRAGCLSAPGVSSPGCVLPFVEMERMTATFNTSEVLEIAEQIERNGAKFYRSAAAIFDEPEICRMLLRLADWEAKHERVFARMRRQLSELRSASIPRRQQRSARSSSAPHRCRETRRRRQPPRGGQRGRAGYAGRPHAAYRHSWGTT